ncbi:MAG: hypothetical protein OHK0039_43450 [Bacteroidia bacterium]
MKQLYSLLLLGLLVPCAMQGQTITAFPYFQTFDAFPLNLGPGFVAEPNPLAFPVGWVNVQAGDGAQDWYTLAAATLTAVTGPTSDHTSGTGIYLYVEDSGAAANNDTVALLTPNFFIGALTNPRLSYWVHSRANSPVGAFGDSSLNHLNVDYWNGSAWVVLDSVGDLGLASDWTERVLDLTGLPGLVQFRFRVNNNNFGDFIHDITIDDLSVYDQPDVDCALIDAAVSLVSPANYTLVPTSQGPSYAVIGQVQNRGIQTVTNVTFKADYGSSQDSVVLASLATFEDSIVSLTPYQPTEGGIIALSVSVAELDTFVGNDTRSVVVVDSVFARDDSTASGGLGFTGATGVFGTMFELTQPDILTSSSFLLTPGATLGDSLHIWLYRFDNQIPNQPDTVAIDVTDYWVITTRGWITLSFTCANCWSRASTSSPASRSTPTTSASATTSIPSCRASAGLVTVSAPGPASKWLCPRWRRAS